MIYLQSVQLSVDPRYCSNVTAFVFNDTEGMSRFNGTADLKVDVLRGLATGSIFMKSSTTKEYDRLIFKTHVDACNLKKGIIGSFVVQMILENLEKHSNLAIPCPLKKGFLYAANFPVGDVSMIPRGIIGLSGEWMAIGSVKGKIDRKKPMVEFGTYRMYGSTE